MTRTQDESEPADIEVVAGNGLLNRRYFLRGGVVAAGGLVSLASVAARAETLTVPEWMQQPGEPFVAYGQPSHYEKIGRSIGATQTTSPGSGASRSPLQSLNGMITPNGLHYERSHNGVPDIDPDVHRLLIHGLVKRPLTFTVEALSRYPMTSRISFVECAGNGGALWAKQPAVGTAATLQGLVSCAEWTGVSLSVLLDEAGVDPKAQWLLAEGADAVGMSRSVPLAKARDDAMIALYQNGERIRPSNGYPIRLLLPGYEGNMNVKWLRRIKMTEGPMMTRDETSRYSILLQDGRVAQFKFPMDAKSVITQPSPGLNMRGPGFYEISGIAWSGNGKVAKVDVSADGGASWAEAALSEPVLSKAGTRFRMPWRWSGGPVVLMSRATDETGYVQPSRNALIAERGAKGAYHYNGVTSWGVSEAGEISHVYA